jgi:predicted RNase H-like HicB family nuclease
MTDGHRVYYTQAEDGSWLAASVSTPWFCISAATEQEAHEKAQRALDFWCSNQRAPLIKNFERTVAPFAPRSVETLQPAALCA